MIILVSPSRSGADTNLTPMPLPELFLLEIFLFNFISSSCIWIVILLIHVLGVNILEWISHFETLAVQWISSRFFAWNGRSTKRLSVLCLGQCWVVMGPRLTFKDVLITLLWVVQVYCSMSWHLIIGLKLVYLRLIFQLLNTFSSRWIPSRYVIDWRILISILSWVPLILVKWSLIGASFLHIWFRSARISLLVIVILIVWVLLLLVIFERFINGLP